MNWPAPRGIEFRHCYRTQGSQEAKALLELSFRKTLNIHLENAQYRRLVKAKGDMTWPDFIMTLAPSKK
jgi:hypothetical protein